MASTCRAAPPSKCGSRRALRSRRGTSMRSRRSSLAPVTTTRRPRIAFCRRSWRRAIVSCSARPPADVDGRRVPGDGVSPARCDDRDAARPSPARAPPLRRFGGCGVEWPRALRPADSVCARADRARDVGRLDADRRSAGRLRAAVGQLRTGLAIDPADARAWHRVRHHDAGRGHLVDRRSRSRSAASLRRTVSNPGNHGGGDFQRPEGGPADHRGRHHGRAWARARRRARRRRSSGSGGCGSAHRAGLPAADRRRAALRHARTWRQPLPDAARVSGRWHAG